MVPLYQSIPYYLFYQLVCWPVLFTQNLRQPRHGEKPGNLRPFAPDGAQTLSIRHAVYVHYRRFGDLDVSFESATSLNGMDAGKTRANRFTDRLSLYLWILSIRI